MPDVNLLSLRSDLILSLEKFEASAKKAEKRFEEIDKQAFANFKLGTAKAKEAFEKIEKRFEDLQKKADIAVKADVSKAEKSLAKVEKIADAIQAKTDFELKANDTKLIEKAENAKKLLGELKKAATITARFDASGFNADIAKASKLITSLATSADTSFAVDTSELDQAQKKQREALKELSKSSTSSLALDTSGYERSLDSAEDSLNKLVEKINTKLAAVRERAEIPLRLKDKEFRVELAEISKLVTKARERVDIELTVKDGEAKQKLAAFERLLASAASKADFEFKANDAKLIEKVQNAKELLTELKKDTKISARFDATQFNADIAKAGKLIADLSEKANTKLTVDTADLDQAAAKQADTIERLSKSRSSTLSLDISAYERSLESAERAIGVLIDKTELKLKLVLADFREGVRSAKDLLKELKESAKISASFDLTKIREGAASVKEATKKLGESAKLPLDFNLTDFTSKVSKAKAAISSLDLSDFELKVSLEKLDGTIQKVERKFFELDKQAYVNLKIGTAKAADVFDKLQARFDKIDKRTQIDIALHARGVAPKITEITFLLKKLKGKEVNINVDVDLERFNAALEKAEGALKKLEEKAIIKGRFVSTELKADIAQVKDLLQGVAKHAKIKPTLELDELKERLSKVNLEPRLILTKFREDVVSIGKIIKNLAKRTTLPAALDISKVKAASETIEGIFKKLSGLASFKAKLNLSELRQEAATGRTIVSAMGESAKLKPVLDLKVFKNKIRAAVAIFEKLSDRAEITVKLNLNRLKTDVEKVKRLLGDMASGSTAALKLDPARFQKNIGVAKEALLKLGRKAVLQLHLKLDDFRKSIAKAKDHLAELKEKAKIQASLVLGKLREDADRAGKILTETGKKGRIVPRLHLQKFKKDASEAKGLVTAIKKDSRFDADMNLAKLRDKTAKAKVLLEKVAAKGVFKPKIDDKDFKVSAGKLSGVFDKVSEKAGSGFAANLKAGILSDVVTGAINRLGDLLRDALRGAASVVGDTLESGQGFASEFNAVRTLAVQAGDSAESIENLKEQAIAIAAVLPLETGDLATMAQGLTRAGNRTQELADGLLQVTANLQVATDTAAEAATGTIAAGSNILDTGGDYARLGDVIANTANNANQTVQDLQATLSGLKGVEIDGDAFGLFSNVLADVEIAGSAQGTAIRNTINFLQKKADKFEEIGFRVFDANGNMRDQEELIVSLANEYRLLNDQERSYIDGLLGERGAPLIRQMAKRSKSDIEDIQASVANADGTLDSMVETMMSGTAQAGTQLSATVDALQTQIGEGLLSITGSLANMLQQGLAQIDTTQLAQSVSAAGEGLMSNFGSFDRNEQTGAQTFTPNEQTKEFLEGAARRLEEWFVSLPQKVEGFKNAIGRVFELFRSGQAVVDSVRAKLAEWEPTLQHIREIIKTTFKNVLIFFEPIGEMLREVFAELSDDFVNAEGDIGEISEGFKEWAPIIRQTGESVAVILKALIKIAAATAKVATKISKWYITSEGIRETDLKNATTLTEILKTYTQITPEAKRSLTTFGAIGALWFTTGETIDWVKKNLGRITKGSIEWLNNIIKQSFEYKAIRAVVEFIKDLFEKVLNSHKETVDAAKEWVTQFEGVQNILDKISPSMEGLKGVVQGIRENIAGSVEGLKEFLGLAQQVQGQAAGSDGIVSTAGNEAARKVLSESEAWVGKEFNAGVYAQCANFVREVFKNAGIDLGVTSDTQSSGDPMAGQLGHAMAGSLIGSDIGEVRRTTDANSIPAGAIVGFANTYGSFEEGAITHVGVSTGGGRMVDRSTSARPVQERAIETFQPDSNGEYVYVVPKELVGGLASGAGLVSSFGNVAQPSTVGNVQINVPSGLTEEGQRIAQYMGNPHVMAALEAIARAEMGDLANDRGGFYTGFGGRDIPSLRQHPYHGSELTPQGESSASGRFQFMGHSFKEEADALGLSDFSPGAQTVAAISRMDFRGVLDEIAAGGIEGVLAELGKEWASIEGNPYGQGTAEGMRDRFLANYDAALARGPEIANVPSFSGSSSSSRTSAPSTASAPSGLQFSEDEVEGVSTLKIPDATIDSSFLDEAAQKVFDEWQAQTDLDRQTADRSRELDRESASEARSIAISDANANDNDALASVLENQGQMVELQETFYDRKLEIDRQLAELYKLRELESSDPLLTQQIEDNEAFRRDLVAREEEAFANLQSQVDPVFRNLNEQTEQLTEKTTELGRSFGLAEDIESRHLQALDGINEAYDEQDKRIQGLIASFTTLLTSGAASDEQNAAAITNIETLVAQQSLLNEQRDNSIALAQQELQQQREAQILAAEAVANRLTEQASVAEQELLQARIRAAELDGKTRLVELLRQESEELKIQEQYRRRMQAIENEERSLVDSANAASPTGVADNGQLAEIERTTQAAREAADATRAISLAEVNEQASELAQKLTTDVQNGLTNILSAMADGTKSIGDALRGMVKNIANTFIQSGIQKLVQGAMSGDGGGGGIGAFISSLFKKGATALADGGPVPYVGGDRNADSTPIMGMPGEFMLSRKMVRGLGGLKSVSRIADMAQSVSGPQYLATGGPVGTSSLIPNVSTNIERSTFNLNTLNVGDIEMVKAGDVRAMIDQMGGRLRTETDSKLAAADKQQSRRLSSSRSYRDAIGI